MSWMLCFGSYHGNPSANNSWSNFACAERYKLLFIIGSTLDDLKMSKFILPLQMLAFFTLKKLYQMSGIDARALTYVGLLVDQNSKINGDLFLYELYKRPR